MKKKLAELLESALAACTGEGLLEAGNLPYLEMELTKDSAHGDYASNVAMVLASRVRKNPRQVAGIIREHLSDPDGILEKTEIAGPGFLNFFVKEDRWAALLAEVDSQGERYGAVDLGKGGNVMVEFVSANPTGPLHIGHARGAVVGDVIARIMAAAGFAVFREYYINDAGNQMHNLGRSVFFRYRELLGEKVELPENCYQGDYIKDIAAEILKRDGDGHRNADEKTVVPLFTDYAARVIMEGIKEDLREFGVTFEKYFSERTLYENDGVAKLLALLEEQGFVYREENTLWFKSTAFGDEKDRVVVRRNGEPTYFAADIAYHKNKFSRGFDTVIDIWGADHHGYIPRMAAGIQALGYDKEALRIVLVQLVNLLRDGKPVAMSTRSGEFVTMKEVVDEVGRDAARYNFLMRRSDSHLDFDLELAKRQSNENPVYYVQYAHARICSIIRTAAERGYAVPRYEDVDVGLLKLAEEIQLIKAITRFPEVVEGAARTLEPHRLTFYLNDLASVFHSYYNKNRVISDDEGLSRARLFLVACVRTALGNALRLLGVSAPEKM
ncbi:MAG: arginine--tRNA ligase [Deltaproteobacteria bacterium]|nr:arginine--tRNA ligase [Deltaproteobacteria bacterium]